MSKRSPLFETIDCIDLPGGSVLLTERARTPKGWLVRTLHSLSAVDQKTAERTVVSSALAFVPDPEHRWVLKPEEVRP